MPYASPALSPTPSLAERAGTLMRDVRDVMCDHLELAALEAQRAGIGLAKLLSAAVVVAILVVSAWLALVAGGIVWATSAGVGWSAALIVASGLNVVLAGLVALWMRSQTQEVLFAASLRQLRRTVTDDAQVPS
jgi:Putative Actinobacterial Holin-X, holin superfamily III